MEDVTSRVREAVAAAEWNILRLLLHPYLHWQLPDGSVVRGRVKVLALLRETRDAGEPRSVELRDGQVYRWMS